MIDDSLKDLAQRIGEAHVLRRLEVETKHESQIFGQGLLLFNLENWYSAPRIIESALRLGGLYERAKRNASRVVVRHNTVPFTNLPAAFDGFTILQISDLHVELSEAAVRNMIDLVDDLRYEVYVLTGDYRGHTRGPFDRSLDAVELLRAKLAGPVYGVLGNHDSIRMTPRLEAIGVRMLFNECQRIVREDQAIYRAGVDDPHFYRADNIGKAAADIPPDALSILLSHSPEIHDKALGAGFDLMLSGHTHGGQLCLPGGIPLKLAATLPRSIGAGAWSYGGLAGYTSVGVGTAWYPRASTAQPKSRCIAS